MKKTIVLLMPIIFLAACASANKLSEVPMVLTIDFVGARSDLGPGSNLPVVNMRTARGHSDLKQFAELPLSYAVVCNPQKTYCKHAVVKTMVTHKMEIISDRDIRVTGVMHSEMGRSKTLDRMSSASFHWSHTLSVPDGVEVIGEYMEDQPFDFVVPLGQSRKLSGLQGVEVSIGYSQ